MTQLFDCSLALDLRTVDPLDLHFELAAFAGRAHTPAGVLESRVAREADVERVELVLAAEDVCAARLLAEEVLRAIEAFTCARFGAGAVLRRDVVLRAAPRLSAADLEDARADADAPFCEQVLAAVREARPAPLPDARAALRQAGTSAPERGLTTELLLDRLEEWRRLAAFHVVAAGSRHVTLAFERLPDDLEAFASELLLVSPEVADAVAELDELIGADPATIARVTVRGLAANLRRERSVHLYWD